MKKENFTADRVAGFKCLEGKTQSIFWDRKTPGLGLRVTSSGAKSYIFESRLHGKTLRVTIGDVRTWTIGKAQAEATNLKALTDKGLDPREQAQERRESANAAKLEARRQTVTLAEAWPVYLKAQRPKWSERHYQDHLRMAATGGIKRKRGEGETVAGPLASLMPMRLAGLTGEKIGAWLQNESKRRPVSAAQSFRKLRAFIRWAEDVPDYKGLVQEDAYTARAVKDSVPPNRTKEGDCLQREQLYNWFAELRKINNPVISAYLQSLLLTGARREEMASLRWEDVDFQWRSMTIRDKVDGTRVIPLTPYVAHLLSALPHRNEWVFSSPRAADGKLAEPRIAHNKALAIAGLPHVSLHGLRRSFGTLCEWVEMPSGISAQIMGHKPSALAEKHYRRRPLDLLRKWHDTIESWILEQAGIIFTPAMQGLRVVTAT
jgi:integrase